jgi:hypothetical protein
LSPIPGPRESFAVAAEREGDVAPEHGIEVGAHQHGRRVLHARARRDDVACGVDARVRQPERLQASRHPLGATALIARRAAICDTAICVRIVAGSRAVMRACDDASARCVRVVRESATGSAGMRNSNPARLAPDDPLTR